MTRYISEELASFAVGIAAPDLPDQVLTSTERAVLDTLAALIAGAESRNASDMRTASRALFGAGAFEAWYADGPPLHFCGALLSNCAAASALDIDDGHRGAAGHPGAAIVPAVLMECARNPQRGSDALAAIAIGYDVALRVGAARRRHSQISFASGVWTAYGVAAAIGRLRGLSADVLAHAIAIAGAEAPQNLPQGACMASSVKGSSPWSTLTAFAAVERAAAGATGSLDLLDRDEVFDTSGMLQDMRRRWLVTETYHKPYAACRYTHPLIDAVLEIRAQAASDWSLEKLESVEADIFPEAAKLPNAIAPKSLEGAQFSLPFATALALVGGAQAFRPLRPECLADPDVLKISSQVRLNYSATEFAGTFPAKTPGAVRIRMNGRSFAARIDNPLGDVANPMTMSDITAKLKEFDPSPRADALMAAVLALRHGPTGDLISLLAGTAP